MRPERESGRGTGLGPQEALGSGWEASQPWGLGLAWAVLQSSDRCPTREVAAALLAPGLSGARPLPRTRTSTPESHAQLLPFTGDARRPGNTNRKLCPEPQGGQGPGVTAGGLAHLSGSCAGPESAAGEDPSPPHTEANDSHF